MDGEEVAMKYIVHPGPMRSKSDGQWHYIGYGDLIRLYDVRPKDCILATKAVLRSLRKSDDVIHLYPRYDENYEIEEESNENR